MLFRRKIEKACGYCVYGTKLSDGQILCAKKGIKQEDDKCRKFTYDPIKRIPAKPKALNFAQYDEKDFSL